MDIERLSCFSLVAEMYQTLATPRTAAHPLGSSAYGISHTGILEWDAISSQGSSIPGATYIHVCILDPKEMTEKFSSDIQILRARIIISNF